MDGASVTLNGVTLDSKKIKDLGKKMKEDFSKPYIKYAKAYGEEAAQNIVQKTQDELDDLIAVNTKEIASIRDEMESNPEYMRAKEVLKDLVGAFNDTVKPMKAAIALAVDELNNGR
jgi:thiaminase